MTTEMRGEAVDAAYNYDAFVRSSAVGMGAVGRGTVRVGEQAPDFTLTALDGEAVRLADLHGRYAVLEFGSIT